MKLLLDTHILIWYFADDEKLSAETRKMIEDATNEIFFSSLSTFEIDLKHITHPDTMPFSGEEIFTYCRQAGFNRLPLDIEHTLVVKNLTRKENTPPHKDPFDRLMLCQAIVEDMLFITHDARISEYVTPMVLKI